MRYAVVAVVVTGGVCVYAGRRRLPIADDDLLIVASGRERDPVRTEARDRKDAAAVMPIPRQQRGVEQRNGIDAGGISDDRNRHRSTRQHAQIDRSGNELPWWKRQIVQHVRLALRYVDDDAFTARLLD